MNYTIKDLNKQFPNDDACIDYIFNYRFGQSYTCPSCGKASWSRIKKRKCYACAWCSFQIHPLAGTIFHKSPTKLTLWFFALYKFANSRNGVAAKELERDLGVTYKTAWRIARQIRKLMDSSEFKLSGIVEVDHAFMGHSKTQGQRDMPRVLGMVQRNGPAKAVKMDKIGLFNAVPLIKAEVQEGSAIMSDSAPMYRQFNFEGYSLNKVNHSKEFVSGVVHTNNVEAFFGQIKRSISGTYHSVSEKHLQHYLDEFSFRLTHSRSGIPMFLVMLNQLCRREQNGEAGKI